ncbi:cell wall integrity and stress response component 2 [Drosophila innubila]|uniref:cell wall integrity and stress response component 2 n=1 Tax=Drosophila innubila TaxID=198719 RepID=UPI00148BEEF8|nr:cell wall integrity and stress response component 2 [Drosophila innubila]
MSTLTSDQRFVVLLLIGLASGAWLSVGTTAQTFTSEDRGSILKFMDVLMNFLDAESDNATVTESPNNNGTTTENVESTTVSVNGTTDSSSSESSTASNATESSTSSSTQSSESTEATSNSTTVATNATDTSSSSTTSTTVTPARRRICFKRVCYKFKNDKGYIY